jgi:hypothetical protein
MTSYVPENRPSPQLKSAHRHFHSPSPPPIVRNDYRQKVDWKWQTL